MRPLFILICNAFILILLSCNKEETDDYNQYGAGELRFNPGISATIDSSATSFDYNYSNFPHTYFDTQDSLLYIHRINQSEENHFLIEGGKFDLNHISFPVTFFPAGKNKPYPWLDISITYDHINYRVSAIDSLLFSLTLNNLQNNKLTGVFIGRLYNSSDTNQSINITSGSFDVEISH